MRFLIILNLALLLGLTPAHAKLTVLACEPEWASLVAELGGAQVSVSSATHARQDPHHIEARPSLLAQARRADLLVCTGAELEAGWLPLLQRESGNPAIQVGTPGYFEAAAFVTLLDKPQPGQHLAGHVHTAGNPHLHLNPHNLVPIARALSQRLQQLDPTQAAFYREKGTDFLARWQAAISKWEQQAAPLRGRNVVVQHGSLAYLLRWIGLQVVADLEPIPGVEPSVNHLTSLASSLRPGAAIAILRTPYQAARPAEWLASRSQIPVHVLPYTVGGNTAAKDLFGLFDSSLRVLTAP
ncbi:MAG: zinc ABC transporter substrate-binding protein [Betaproteobacteria bacterium]|nr:zinc ABC transporter substrate-binding protein [Betaproteobacteria bacterium]